MITHEQALEVAKQAGVDITGSAETDTHWLIYDKVPVLGFGPLAIHKATGEMVRLGSGPGVTAIVGKVRQTFSN